MTTTQMRYFLTAARTLNFTRAAKELFLSQPALSKQIVSLEQELNVTLFLREDNNVRLTPAGALLAQELPGLLQRYEQLVQDAQAANEGYTGTLHIGSLEGQWFGPHYTELIRAFMTQYPRISLSLTQGSYGPLRRQLREGTLDLILTQQCEAAEPGFRWQEAGALPCYLVSALNVAASAPLFLPSPQDSRHAYQQGCAMMDAQELHNAIELVPNLTTMLHWIEAGQGIGIATSLSSVLSNPTIHILRELPSMSYCWLWSADRSSAALQQFLQHMEGERLAL